MSNKKNKSAADQNAAPANTKEEVLGSAMSEPTQSAEAKAEAEKEALAKAEAEKEALAKKASVQIGKEKVELEFLEWVHPDGHKLRFKQASHGKILTAEIGEVTPTWLCQPENKDKLIEFQKNHPNFFTEVFE